MIPAASRITLMEIVNFVIKATSLPPMDNAPNLTLPVSNIPQPIRPNVSPVPQTTF